MWLVENWRLVAVIGIALALAGGAAYFYHEGGTAADNKHAADTLKETNSAVKERAKVEDKTHAAPDSDLINSVR